MHSPARQHIALRGRRVSDSPVQRQVLDRRGPGRSSRAERHRHQRSSTRRAGYVSHPLPEAPAPGCGYSTESVDSFSGLMHFSSYSLERLCFGTIMPPSWIWEGLGWVEEKGNN